MIDVPAVPAVPAVLAPLLRGSEAASPAPSLGNP